MNDDLVLNLAIDEGAPSNKKGRAGKGGRWTDRVKAKRVAKRKARPDDNGTTQHAPADSPVSKKPRKEVPVVSANRQLPAPHRPIHVISSLFSFNPKVENPHPSPHPKIASKPSNAPLGDSSTFAGLGLDPLLVSHLSAKMKIAKPTSIQRSALTVLIPTLSDPVFARDAFIQAQTGSGKTLSYLLPILQDLLPLSSLSYIDRSFGTLAIIIAPTRELAKQIYGVVETLLQLRLRPEDDSVQDPTSSRMTRWLIPGILTGGATRAHEKARLRKGIPILISTPGRLLDHLQNTSSFNVAKCRWLVLDEADRLMDLGFEEAITAIVKALEGRRRLALKAVEAGNSMEIGGWNWEQSRRVILCSATIREDVQKLAGTALVNPLVIKATEIQNPSGNIMASALHEGTKGETGKFNPPSQLAQKYIVVPLKLRLITLVALLRSLIAQAGTRAIKIIVFFSCTDSVDFYWHLLCCSSMDDEVRLNEDATESSDEDDCESGQAKKTALQSSLFYNAHIYRLHGSLPPPIRAAALHAFTRNNEKPARLRTSSVLFCTSVASRGLDLPLVRTVIQYDLPTEGGATEYIHRVGRTARAGKGGEAWSIVLPSETGWVKWVEESMLGEENSISVVDEKPSVLTAVGMESILKAGLGGEKSEYENRATQVQLSFERWVLRTKENINLARKAYKSHMRAYATHPLNEKHIFHLRSLHLGHLAKSFALRDAPTLATVNFHLPALDSSVPAKNKRGTGKKKKGDAEKRMQNVVRERGRLVKRRGVMSSSGTSEYQIAGVETLERLVR